MEDVASTITTAISGFDTQLLTVAGAGIGLAVIVWGVPKALGFFKRTAK